MLTPRMLVLHTTRGVGGCVAGCGGKCMSRMRDIEVSIGDRETGQWLRCKIPA